MMNSRTRIAGAALLLGMAVGGHAQITKVGNKYQFRMMYTVGKTITSKMAMDTSVNTGTGGSSMPAMKMAMPMKVKCTGKKGDVYTLVTTSGPMTMNGKAFQGSKPETVTVKANSKGEIVEGSASAMNFSSMKLPTNPIAVGSTWKGTINMPQGQGAVNANYKFNGVKTVNGPMGKMNGSGTMNLLMSDGQPLTMSMKMAGDINAGAAGGGTGSAPMKMSMSITVNRV
jgi:hypothetical protein